jgi:Rrf2 family iron-sulfur cluster assembly transcriptional regulator
MKLTTKSRYALRAIVELANAPGDQPVTLAVIADHQCIKMKYLEQIFLRLHRAGLVTSRKGPGGGYMLAREPRRIRLSDVLQAVGESTAPVLCAVNKRDKYCAGIAPCPLQHHWRKLKRHIDTFFENLTVADLCQDGRITGKKKKARLYGKG